MIALEVWRSARVEVTRTLRATRVWAWLALPLAAASIAASIAWVTTVWQLPCAVIPVLVSEAARRVFRRRRLGAAVHDIRALVGHEVALLPVAEVATLLTRGVVVHEDLQIAAVADADVVRFETEEVAPSAVPPLTTIFMRGGGAGGGGAVF